MGATIARMSLRDGFVEEYEALLGARRLLALADQNKPNSESESPFATHWRIRSSSEEQGRAFR